MEKTLKEVCVSYHVSRRAIKWYEKAGLLVTGSHTTNGNLLYDIIAQKRIERIRLFQNMEFSVKEIGQYIDAPDEELKSILISRLEKLQVKVEFLKETIQKGYELISLLDESI